MISYNTIEISTAKMDMRIFEADNKTSDTVRTVYRNLLHNVWFFSSV